VLVCCIVYFGCDSGSGLYITEEDKPDLEYEYVEVDLDLMAKLSQISEEDAIGGEPQIEIYYDQQPIKRFRSYHDFYTSTDLIAENSRLTGAPILIHGALKQYLEYQYFVPSEELAFVNYAGQLIIGDTLYTLVGTSYQKQHIDDQVSENIDLYLFNPSDEIIDILSQLLIKEGVTRVSDVLTLNHNSKSAGFQSGCGRPDDFGFVGGSDPTRSVRHTNMCVADFNYPSIRVDPSDYEFTSNAPGAVVMWNTSYTTWTGARRGIANTRFFKYRVVNGGRALAYLNSFDIPYGVTSQVKVTVYTRYHSSTDVGTLSVWASVSRKKGTTSRHSATYQGVTGLPDNYPIN